MEPLPNYWIVFLMLGLGSVGGAAITRFRYGSGFFPRVVRWEVQVGVALTAIGAVLFVWRLA
jgi:hypothetical protein